MNLRRMQFEFFHLASRACPRNFLFADLPPELELVAISTG